MLHFRLFSATAADGGAGEAIAEATVGKAVAEATVGKAVAEATVGKALRRRRRYTARGAYLSMQNPSTLYRKTDAGTQEMQARTMALRAELRRLLILVDGQTPLARLEAFAPGAAVVRLLAELETLGLITREGASSGPSQAVAAVDAAPEPTEIQIAAVRRTAIRLLREMLGRDADAWVARVERCHTAAALRHAATDIRQSLERSHGRAAAQGFLDQLRRAAEAHR